jgi:transcriptional regulator with XRE-family HTH domain
MTQAQLGTLMGKAQPWISQLENPDYGKWTVATLLDLADAFDTDLEIKFRPFSRSLYELSHQNHEYFQVQSFDEELPALERATTGWVASRGKWSDSERAWDLLNRHQGAEGAVKVPSSLTSQMVTKYAQYSSPVPTATPWHPRLTGTQFGTTIAENDYEKDKRRRKPKGIVKRAA